MLFILAKRNVNWNLLKPIMDKIIDFIMLIFLAFGSAILFTFVVIWKFIQAIYQLIFSNDKQAKHQHLHTGHSSL